MSTLRFCFSSIYKKNEHNGNSFFIFAWHLFLQFPTGNGKIDIIIEYKSRVYGIELKSYTDTGGYKSALNQAASYGKQLELKEVLLVFFLEGIDKRSREKYEKHYLDESAGVKVIPIFVETG